MKNFLIKFATAIFTILIASQTTQASHMAGTDITYEYTGVPNTYLVRIKYYRDCLGIPAANQINVCWFSSSLGLSGSQIAPNISMTPVPNTPCVNAVATCPGGIGDIEEHIFETTITLPQPATDWIFSFTECCRNVAITCIANPGGTRMYNSCTLNNLVAPTNSSPYFLNLAYTRFCVGNQFFYDQGAIDVDGDSLVFSLVTAEDDLGACPPAPFPVTYIAPYSPTNPLASSIPITINSSTGVVNFIPSVIQVAVVCVLVREYRNGVLIGQVKRDIQINIVPACNQIDPSFLNSILTSGGGQINANCNDYSVIIPFDTSFQCGSAVPTDFRAITPFGVPNPLVSVVPINCANGQTDSLLVTFLNPLTVGETYIWIKRGFDGNTLLSECGSEIAEFADTVRILVQDNSVWSPITDTVGCFFNTFSVTLSDSVYCFSIANDGSDLQLVDANGNNLPIANAYGYCNPGGLKTNQLLVNMTTNTFGNGPLYLLLNNAGGTDGNTIANDCGRFLTSTDTLAVLLVDNFIIVDLGTDQTICDNATFPLLDPNTPGATSYQWFLNSTAIPGATSATYQTTQSGTYGVQVTAGGCSGDTSMTLTVNTSPVVTLANETICDYDPIPTLSISPVPNGTYQWLNGGSPIVGATSTSYSPTAAGNYSVEVTIPPGCTGTGNMTLTINAAPVLAIADQDICSDQLATLDAGVAGATYTWSNGGNTQTITTATAGTYSVNVSLNNCSSDDTAVVNVFYYPVAPVVACNPGTGTYKFIYVWAAVSGAASYEVSEDGGATWIPANVPTGPESHGVNVNIPNFTVRAIGSGLCKTGASSEPTACEVTIPNIFTPNGDNTNEFFELENIEQYPNNSVQIFNRWGKEVYNEGGYNNSTKKFDGKDLPDGVYFYIVDLGNGVKAKAGTVTINR